MRGNAQKGHAPLSEKGAATVMETQGDIRICLKSLELDPAWQSIYESSFSAADRDTIPHLKKQVEDGKMLLHKTLNKNGELLCFTLTWLGSNFSLLAYMATDSTRRSGGYGSKHLKQLANEMRNEYPHHIALFVEIEAVAAAATDEQRKERKRRRNFYLRSGARRLCRDLIYYLPVNGEAEWQGELLAVEFNGPLGAADLEQSVWEMLKDRYGLSDDSPIARKVLSHFDACCATATCIEKGACLDEEAPTD